MGNFLFVLLAILGGLMGGIQAPINGTLGRKIGGLEASLVSFFIGTFLLVIIVLFFGKGNVFQLSSVPKWQLIGGGLGAIFVTCIILSVPNIGAATTILAAIVGQMTMTVLIDHFGLFGVEQIPIDWNRIIGLILMACALFFIFRGGVST